jgi:hypothetical protein
MKYAVYAWIIDTDHIDAGHDASTIGPRNVSPLMENALQSDKKHGIPFKMYDDDGELYYSGRILLNLSDPDAFEGGEEFAPLDDFGMPNAGCTSIHYQNTETKKWAAI